MSYSDYGIDYQMDWDDEEEPQEGNMEEITTGLFGRFYDTESAPEIGDDEEIQYGYLTRIEPDYQYPYVDHTGVTHRHFDPAIIEPQFQERRRVIADPKKMAEALLENGYIPRSTGHWTQDEPWRGIFTRQMWALLGTPVSPTQSPRHYETVKGQGEGGNVAIPTYLTEKVG